MDLIQFVLAANEINVLSIASDIGTIAAGFAATIALIADLYARLFSKQPQIYISLKTSSSIRDSSIKLSITNYGEASARIISVETTPGWHCLCTESNANALACLNDYTLTMVESLTFTLDEGKISKLLFDYYHGEIKASKPFHISVKLTYQPVARSLRKKPKTITFDTNLTCAYMRSHL